MDWLKVRGESMRPLLREGDEVGVEWDPEPGKGVREGDLVVFRDPGGEWIVHRVVAAPGGRVLTKGDASYRFEQVPDGEVWGRVVKLRSPRSGREGGLGRHWLDAVIAGVSRRSAGGSGLVSKLEFRLVRVLGAIRRHFARA